MRAGARPFALWQLMRECNAAPCPSLHAVHKISKVVRANLPLDDETTEGDESAINAAIFMESTALIRILVDMVKAHHARGADRHGSLWRCALPRVSAF